MGSKLPPLDWHSFLTQWELRPVWDLAILVALAAYLWGLCGAHRQGVRTVHPARVVSFLSGLTLLALTLNSSVDAYAPVLFWMHMIEHLMLIMVIPACLVVGHPLTAVVAGQRPGRREHLQALLVTRPAALVTRPIFGFGFYAGVVVATHLTSFMDQMMLHAWLTSGEQALYLVAGYLFLLPLLGNEPIRWHPPHMFRILMMVIGMIPDTVVGIVLLQTNNNLFPLMLSDSNRPLGAPDPVHDLNIGGGLMWALGDGLMMTFAVGLVVALITHPQRADLLGGWLENVRRQTLSATLGGDPDDGRSIADSGDLDNDDATLAAYNRMLQRVHVDG
ncbi:MAG: cytochrome c oxidase assembly protein [Mycobacteriaceae bacterium]